MKTVSPFKKKKKQEYYQRKLDVKAFYGPEITV